jgi:hypothetical protein
MKRKILICLFNVCLCFVISACGQTYEYKPTSGVAPATIREGNIYGSFTQHGIHSIFKPDVKDGAIGSIDIMLINGIRTGYISNQSNEIYKINPGKNNITLVLELNDIDGTCTIEFDAMANENYIIEAKGQASSNSFSDTKGQIVLQVKDSYGRIKLSEPLKLITLTTIR